MKTMKNLFLNFKIKISAEENDKDPFIRHMDKEIFYKSKSQPNEDFIESSNIRYNKLKWKK